MSSAPPRNRSVGIRLITSYKLVKAPVMLVAALWLSIAPRSAVHAAEVFARELAEGGATLALVAHYTSRHLSMRVALDAAILAWVDGISTAAEGLLLFYGSVWGEWIVVIMLAAPIPVELRSLGHHFSVARLTVLTTNVCIVAYLARRRLSAPKGRARLTRRAKP